MDMNFKMNFKQLGVSDTSIETLKISGYNTVCEVLRDMDSNVTDDKENIYATLGEEENVKENHSIKPLHAAFEEVFLMLMVHEYDRKNPGNRDSILAKLLAVNESVANEPRPISRRSFCASECAVVA